MNALRIAGAVEKAKDHDLMVFFYVEVNGVRKPPKKPTSKMTMERRIQQRIPGKFHGTRIKDP